MVDFQCPVSRFDLARYSYLPDCKNLRISAAPKDDPDNLDTTIVRLFACQKALKNTYVTHLPFLENLRDLSFAVARRLETHTPPSIAESLRDGLHIGPKPDIYEFHRELLLLINCRERELSKSLDLLLQEDASSEVSEAKNKVERLSMILSDAGQGLITLNLFKRARTQFQAELAHLLDISTADSVDRWVTAAIRADSEFNFMRHFLSKEQPPLKHAGFNIALKAIGRGDIKAQEVARFRVSMYLEAVEVLSGSACLGIERNRRAFNLSEMQNLDTILPDAQERALALVKLMKATANHPCKREAGNYLQRLASHLIKLEDSIDWLTGLIQENCDSASLSPILDVIMPSSIPDTSLKSTRVSRRYHQIASTKERSALSKADQFFLAYFIETERRIVSIFNSQHIRKPARGQPPLARPRSLIHTGDGGDFIILGKRKDPGLVIPRVTKRFSPVIYLPHDSKKPPLYGLQWVGILTSGRSILSFRSEASIHQALNGKTGIWPLLDVCSYLSKQNPAKLQQLQISVCQLLADGTLLHALNQDVHLSNRQIFSVLHQVIMGLEYMHTVKNLVHGHINPTHIFFKKQPDGLCLSGIAGFSAACYVGSQELPGNVAKGSYGSMAYTAPELVGQKDFKGDLRKLDIFAFGCLIYQWLYGQDAPWMQIRDQKQHHLVVDKFVKQPHKTPSGAVGQLHTLMLCMLTANPEERSTITQVCAVMNEIDALIKNPRAPFTAPMLTNAPRVRLREHFSFSITE